MKYLVNVCKFFVGALFIFSGLIKVNDPIGTAIKMEEYFHVFSEDIASFFGFFVPLALPIAVIFVVFEVVLGIAILFNYRMKYTSWVALGLIVFFTFLTFYSAYFNKVTDCGCFGDAIKLTPWESFTKDIVLLLLIVLLVAYRKRLIGFSEVPFRGDFMISVSTLLTLGIAFYAIAHLPFIDFRPYKVGNDIGKQMKPAAKPKYKYIMTKDGQEYELDKYDKAYTFKEMKLLNPEEATPKIQDYAIWNDEADVTQESLKGTKLLVAVHKVDKVDRSMTEEINKLTLTMETEIDVWAITSSDGKSFEKYRHEVQLATPYYFVDATVLKAMIRSNPGILLFRDGVVLGKWHYNDVPSPEEVKKLLAR